MCLLIRGENWIGIAPRADDRLAAPHARLAVSQRLHEFLNLKDTQLGQDEAVLV
jgi:hypothetical protein